MMTNLLHFELLVGLDYKAAAVSIRHTQRQGANKLFFVQHRGKHRYRTENKQQNFLVNKCDVTNLSRSVIL